MTKRVVNLGGTLIALLTFSHETLLHADADMARFAAVKEAQAREFAATLTNKVPDITWSFFDAVRVDDWQTATNLAERLRHASGLYSRPTKVEFSEALRSPVWQAISETLGAYEQFQTWDKKWLRRFGKEIMDSIPPGSIYFGGTDPGRFVITVLSESHRDGKPFFTVTQNQLADGIYLEYLRKLYGGKIYVATEEDSRQAFQEYVADAQARLKSGKLKPGEDVRVVNDKVQVSGQVAVMAINGLIAKVMVEKNPGREVYVEESFPLEWMYPQVSPHGLILKLEAKPMAQLRDEVVRKDQEYWRRLMMEILGAGVTEKSSLQETCDFVEKIYRRKDLKEFKGDPAFVQDEDTQKCFSKLRSSIGGIYAWRAEQAKDADERERMWTAAEGAFRQAFVLCPYSPEAVYRYVQLLSTRGRFDDAILVVGVAVRFDEADAHFKDLLRNLRERAR